MFSKIACLGNPVCVFLESDGLNQDDMQKIARWTNLSETTFVSKSKIADYKVRIFTPNEELPFAGHPTLGTAWALHEAGIVSGAQFMQECDLGLVPITVEQDKIYFELPSYKILESIDDKTVTKALSVPCQECLIIDTGPIWIIGRLNEVDALDKIQLDKDSFNLPMKGHATGVTVYAIDHQSQVHARTFFDAGNDIVEDPVCGSGNAAVAVHIREMGLRDKVTNPYTSFQGKYLQRQGEVLVEMGDKIKVGGQCHTIFDGHATI